MPRDFSESGAYGAGSGAGNDAGGFGTEAGSFGSGHAASGGSSTSVNGGPFGGGMVNNTGPDASEFENNPEVNAHGLMYAPPPPKPTYGRGQLDPNSRPPVGGIQDTTGIGGWGMQFTQGGDWSMGFTSDWANGGAIPMEGEEPDFAGGADPYAGLTEMVKSVLAYGRQKHGLSGGADPEEGAIPGAQANAGYQNGRMPAVPGTQSESGIKPLQPAPGRLPPTQNPFGKRAEAEPEEETGAIDTEEEAA